MRKPQRYLKQVRMNLSLFRNVFAKYLPVDFPGNIDVLKNKFMAQPGESLIDASNRIGVFDHGELKNLNKTFNNKDKSTPQVVKTAGEPERLSPDVKAIINSLENLSYKVRKEDSKNYNLNIVGIRNEEVKLNQFNDELWVFWKFESFWKLNKYKITTNPGLFWLTNPMNPKGTATLKEGQYLNSHIFGKHRGKYDALVQSKPLTVIRDFNKDNKLDYDSGKTQSGLFGINVHRASEFHETKFVDKYSAGCQVFSSPTEFNDFIRLCKLYMAEWGNSFTYTLILKSQIKYQ